MSKLILLSGMLAQSLGVQASRYPCEYNRIYAYSFMEIGFGSVLSKNMSTVNSILRQITSDQTEKSVTTFDEIDVDVVEFNPEPGSKVTKVPLEEINFPEDSIVGVINHHGNLSIARGETQLNRRRYCFGFCKV